MGGTGEKIRLKPEKCPIFLGLKGEFIHFVHKALEHPFYIFLMTNWLILSQKSAKDLSTVVGQVRYIITPVLVLIWIRQNFVFIGCPNQKLRRKNFSGSSRPPPVSEGLR